MPLGQYTLDLNKNINNDFPLEKETKAVKSKAIQYIRLARMGHLKERTDSDHATDQPCSSGASAAACTEVISILEHLLPFPSSAPSRRFKGIHNGENFQNHPFSVIVNVACSVAINAARGYGSIQDCAGMECENAFS